MTWTTLSTSWKSDPLDQGQSETLRESTAEGIRHPECNASPSGRPL